MQQSKVHLVSYSDDRFRKSGKRLMREAVSFDHFETLRMYTPADICTVFCTRHKEILKAPLGGGYWLWKPYVINQRLREIPDGDFLVYLDAGCTINKSGKQRFLQYLGMLENPDVGVLSFQFTPDHWRPESNWTVEELFTYFGQDITSPIASTGQYIASVMLFRKNDHSLALLDTVMRVVEERPDLFTDKYNQNNAGRSGFVNHRHDQSVFSIARKLSGSVVLTDETKFPNGPPAMEYHSKQSRKYPFWCTKIRDRSSLRGYLHRLSQLRR